MTKPSISEKRLFPPVKQFLVADSLVTWQVLHTMDISGASWCVLAKIGLSRPAADALWSCPWTQIPGCNLELAALEQLTSPSPGCSADFSSDLLDAHAQAGLPNAGGHHCLSASIPPATCALAHQGRAVCISPYHLPGKRKALLLTEHIETSKWPTGLFPPEQGQCMPGLSPPAAVQDHNVITDSDLAIPTLCSADKSPC